MEQGIELDNIPVVEVTGKAHRDRQRRSRKGSCDCSPSLRATTILIFVCIGIVYVIALVIGDLVLYFSLADLDQTMCNNSINRLTMLIEDDMTNLRQLTNMYAHSTVAFECMTNISKAINEGDEAKKMETIDTFFLGTGINTTYNVPISETEMITVSVYQASSLINYMGFLDLNFNTVYGVFYPGDIATGVKAGTEQQWPPPYFKPEAYKRIYDESGRKDGNWHGLLVPDGGCSVEPMIVSFEGIKDADSVIKKEPNPEFVGYFVCARTLLHRIPMFSDAVPTCISIHNGADDDKSKWDKTDLESFEQAETTPGFSVKKEFGGTPVFVQRDNETLGKSRDRFCPSVPLFNATSSLMTGYIQYCGSNPKVHTDKHDCFWIRVDRPMSMVEEGIKPLLIMSAEIIVIVIVLFVIFVVFLDCVVLRRIEALSNVIKKQTRGHAKAQEEEDETTAATSNADDDDDEKDQKKHGKSAGRSKSGKSASGSSENSRTSSEGGDGPARITNARDEIGNLKRAMEQNALGLRKRLEAVNDSIKAEQQRSIHHKQAMQLLNLWCGRKDYFPGLRPNAMQLRYEPTRNLDDILNNPLAIEYLKSHCESDRTLENLWFVLDVSWLEQLEAAEDNEEIPEKRQQIHDVAEGAALNIIQRYIATNAPQEVNLSAGTFKRLREVGEVYSRKMFDEAVSEVKLMLNTDILPRFQKTSAYSAMSETLYIDSSGGGDESSEFSEETGSTAGSVLTDEIDEAEGNVGRVFAHTFKNLHQAFDVGHDDNSSSCSASSSHATNSGVIPTSASLAAGTIDTTTSGEHAEGKDKDGSSVSGSSDASEPEPPKLEEKKEEEPVAKKEQEPAAKKEEEPVAKKEEEPVAKKEEDPAAEKEEAKESADSSSSNSISSDTMSSQSSSSESASDESD